MIYNFLDPQLLIFLDEHSKKQISSFLFQIYQQIVLTDLCDTTLTILSSLALSVNYSKVISIALCKISAKIISVKVASTTRKLFC